MKLRTPVLLLLLVTGFGIPATISAKEKKPTGPPKPVGWAYISDGPRDFIGTTLDLHKIKRKISQGWLLPVFRTKQKDGETYARVSSLNLETEIPEDGWIKISPAELKPAGDFPVDDDLIALLGGPYLDDVVADHTWVGRLLVHQSQGKDLLVCYLLSGQVMMAKLMVFVPQDGKFVPGDSVNIPIAEAQNGISSIETRDLVGDGNDCLISREDFYNLTNISGTNVTIRRVTGGQIRTVWQAPVKFKNLWQYSSEIHVLQPPDRNIGEPGTVTTGEVTYKSASKGQTPVWKGKVDFFVINHDKPLNSVDIEKSCPWTGTEFTPFR